MRLTPLDLRNQRFARGWRGYDCTEVDTFLQMAAEDYESIAIEAETLRRRSQHLETRVTELESNEKSLREAILSAQSMGREIREAAIKESEHLIGSAEVRAEKIIDAAHRRLTQLSEDIRQMKRLRHQLATAVRSTVQTHLALLEQLAADDADGTQAENNVAYLSTSAESSPVSLQTENA